MERFSAVIRVHYKLGPVSPDTPSRFEIVAHCPHQSAFLDLIAGFGSNYEVVGPPKLRDAMRARVSKVAALYANEADLNP